MRTLTIDYQNGQHIVTMRGSYHVTPASQKRLEQLPFTYLTGGFSKPKEYIYTPDLPIVPQGYDTELLLAEWREEDKARAIIMAIELAGVGVYPGELDGNPFIIFDGWREVRDMNKTLNSLFADPVAYEYWRDRINWGDMRVGARGRIMGERLDNDSPPYYIPAGLLHIDQFIEWGFSDEYGTCAGCGTVLRHSPDSYSWTPDFWESDDGYICKECLDPEEYIEWAVEKSRDGSPVGCNLITPEEHNFTLILSGLENGLHHGQADDPCKLLDWASDNSLSFIFTVQPSQFYTSFDVYGRKDNGEELTAEEVGNIRLALTGESEPGRYSDTLLPDFREYPTPAQRCEAALKGIRL